MLSLKNITVRYDGVQAVKKISIDVEKGSITSLIGANGAGKSTTLKAISGLVPLTSGEIWFEGERIDGREPEKIVELGIGHVPEGKQLFLDMSVLDNLLTGAHLRKDADKLQEDLERIYNYFPILRTARNRKASTLSGGEQQMLAIGRGLMCRPKLLLLDEPSLGLSPILTSEVGSIIKRIADEGVSILLIEQNANLALQLAKKNYVMETGTIALEGDSKQLQNDDHVKAAYLGISPTEESPAIWAQEKRAPKTRTPEKWQDQAPPERWQDKGPQGRWQDKDISERVAPERKEQEGRAQDRRVPPGEVTVMRPQDKETQEGWAQAGVSQDLESPDRWAQESRLPAGDSSDRWAQDREAPERWQDREAPERWADKGAPERWLDRGVPRGWQDRESLASRPRDRWADREPSGRRPQGRETPGLRQDREATGRLADQRPPKRWLDQGPQETWRDREVPARSTKDRWPRDKQAPSRMVKKTFVPKGATKS